MHRVWRTSIVAAIVGAQFIPATSASARSFGDGPLNAVLTQAGGISLCADLTVNKVAAIMLAPTWGEAGAGTGSPSPEAMGREDTYQLSSSNLRLYSFSSIATQERAYFHAGIGMWMLDDAGVGANLPAFQRIDADTAAKKVASIVHDKYCNSSGTAAQRRAVVFGTWYACNGGACESIFQSIYCSSTNSLCNVTRDTNVTKKGGTVQRTCRQQGSKTTFTCFYVNIGAADGVTTIWKRDPKTGASGGGSPSPLTQEFYDWDNSNGVENRDWLEADTGYGSEVRAKRTEGANSRTSTTWNTPAFSDALCDVSLSRGHCTSPNL